LAIDVFANRQLYKELSKRSVAAAGYRQVGR
jgi:hypothetical protein